MVEPGRSGAGRRRFRPPSLLAFARVMLGVRLLGLAFVLLWISDGFSWVKLMALGFVVVMVGMQVARVRAIGARDRVRRRG